MPNLNSSAYRNSLFIVYRSQQVRVTTQKASPLRIEQIDKRPSAYRTASPITEQRSIAIRSRFLPPEQLFPKNLVLLARCTRLAVSHADEQVGVLAGRRLQVLTINC